MGIDFPRAWELAHAAPAAAHDPECSYRQTGGALLCDCHVLTAHPEWHTDILYTKGGVPYVPSSLAEEA